MDVLTVIGSLVASYLGTLFLTVYLNIPDGGAIFAIAFIGGRIVSILKKQKTHSDMPSPAESSSDTET